jgi:hypothetical protein
MHVHPSLSLMFLALLGIAMSCIVMAMGVLWARVRSLPVEETTRLVEDLVRRQESIEGLLSRLEMGPEPDKTGNGAAVAVSIASPEARAEATRPHPRRVDPAAAIAFGGPTLIAVPSLSASVKDASAEAAAELGRRFGAIWALADAGEPAEAIARTIGQPIGQVELILGLRRQLPLSQSHSSSPTSQPGGHA